MNGGPRASNSRLAAVAVLGGVGRLVLALAAAFGLTHALWGYPPDARRIYLGLVAAAVLLAGAACIVRDPRWLLQVAVWGLAVACVILVGAIARVYFARSPRALWDRELYAGIAALAFFVFACIYLRRERRRGEKR